MNESPHWRALDLQALEIERQRLIGWVMAEFHLNAEEAEDCVQDAWLELLGYANPSAASLRSLVRQRAIDRVRRRKLEQAAFVRLAQTDDGVRLEDLAHIVDQPERAAQLDATFEARKTLLSDAVRAWTRQQEARGALGWRDKQIIERIIRGEEVDDVATNVLGHARGVSTVYQVMVQFRDWLAARLDQPDVHQSVVATFVERDAQDRLALKPKRAFELLRWVVVDFRAMCPGRERLAAYHRNPTAPEFSDLHYHVRSAPTYRAVYSTDQIDVGCTDCQRQMET